MDVYSGIITRIWIFMINIIFRKIQKELLNGSYFLHTNNTSND